MGYFLFSSKVSQKKSTMQVGEMDSSHNIAFRFKFGVLLKLKNVQIDLHFFFTVKGFFSDSFITSITYHTDFLSLSAFFRTSLTKEFIYFHI